MKGRLRTALGTVLYKTNKDFLRDFIRSVKWQSDQEFDLLIVNDNAEISDLACLNDCIKNNILITNAGKGSLPYQNRIDLLKIAKKKQYELLVLLDFDDLMYANRISEYKQQFDRDYTFFYNDLKTNTGEKVFRVLPENVFWGDILESNFLGLSNTGINMGQLEMPFIDSLSAGSTFVFDWYMYERILLENKKGKRINHSWTEYRIYENNIAGIHQDIRKEILVKREHYALLKDFHDIYRYLYKRYLQLDFDNGIRVKDHNGYWWENIKLLEENKSK